ncbi:hypothetical protein ACC678_37405, partial [Rhizobium ruizarguesonis]
PLTAPVTAALATWGPVVKGAHIQMAYCERACTGIPPSLASNGNGGNWTLGNPILIKALEKRAILI